MSNCVNECDRGNLEKPGNEGSVEPVAVLLASVLESLLRLVCDECLLLTVDLVLASVEVGLVRLDALRLHDNLVAKDADKVDRNALKIVLINDLRLHKL